MYGSCLIAHSSRTQVSVTLSCAEAELNAAVKAACEALGMNRFCAHFGITVDVKMFEMFGDSFATQGTLRRKGFGKVKHLDDRQLFLQDHILSIIEAYFLEVPGHTGTLGHPGTLGHTREERSEKRRRAKPEKKSETEKKSKTEKKGKT